MHKLLGYILVIATLTQVNAQDYIESINAAEDNDIIEWDVYTHETDGTLELTWALQRDFTDWTFEIGDVSGTIRQQWLNDDTQYELRTDEGHYIKMRVKWPNDYSEWIIESDSIPAFTWIAKQFNDGNHWEADRTGDLGTFEMYTEVEDDPRDWIIKDEIYQELFAEKVACMFIAIIRATSSYR